MPHVLQLGSCITLLNEGTREQLRERSPRPSDLAAVHSLPNYLERATLGPGGEGGNMFMGGFGGVGGGGGGFGGGGSGGFGGFGGGSFGGGGAGGSW